MRTPPQALLLVLVLMAGEARADLEAFEIEAYESDGRTLAAELVDVNGDGRTDLLQAVFVDFPPRETRWIRVFLQGPDGRLPHTPDRVWRLPPGCAAFDLADVLPEPGVELLLLRADGVLVVSLAAPEPVLRELRVQGTSTLAPAQDERGLDRARLAWTGLADEPWLFIPVPGEFIALGLDGEQRARLRVGTRANYLVPPRPGPVFVESELQVFIDVPILSLGDVNGDGRLDLVSASRHDLRVFLRRPDGSFPRDADQRLALARVSAQDHLRGSGAVRVQLADLNGDQRLDLVISQVAGALTDAHTSTSVHLNRGDGWDLDDPDWTLETEKAWTADQLVDLDQDGRPELVRIEIPITLMEMIEMLVTQAVDARVTIHKVDDQGVFSDEPWVKKKLDIPFSFDTGRPRGFTPTLNGDFNGDGHLDFLTSGDGQRIEVYLGGEDGFRKRHARQEMESGGRVRFGDLNADGLDDFVLYSPRRPGAPMLIGINTGQLPGSPPRMSPAAE